MKRHTVVEADVPAGWLTDAWRARVRVARAQCGCARCCQGRPCDPVLRGGPCEMRRCDCRSGHEPAELNFDDC